MTLIEIPPLTLLATAAVLLRCLLPERSTKWNLLQMVDHFPLSKELFGLVILEMCLLSKLLLLFEPESSCWVRLRIKIAWEKEDWAFILVKLFWQTWLPCLSTKLRALLARVTLNSLRPDQIMLPSLSSLMVTCGSKLAGEEEHAKRWMKSLL